MAHGAAESALTETDALKADVEDLRGRVEHLLAERERLFVEREAALGKLARIDKAVRELPQNSGAVRLAALLSRLRRMVSPRSPTLNETLARVLDDDAR